jgi:hypothetical protein
MTQMSERSIMVRSPSMTMPDPPGLRGGLGRRDSRRSAGSVVRNGAMMNQDCQCAEDRSAPLVARFTQLTGTPFGQVVEVFWYGPLAGHRGCYVPR